MTASGVQTSACRGGPSLDFVACISEMDNNGIFQVLGLATVCAIVLCLGLKSALRTAMQSHRLGIALRKQDVDAEGRLPSMEPVHLQIDTLPACRTCNPPPLSSFSGVQTLGTA